MITLHHKQPHNIFLYGSVLFECSCYLEVEYEFKIYKVNALLSKRKKRKKKPKALDNLAHG